MKTSGFLPSALFAVVLCLAVLAEPFPRYAAAAFVQRTVTKKKGFLQISTKHYIIRAQSKENLCQRVAAHMEDCISRYSLIFENLYTKPKARVVVLNNDGEYKKYLGASGGSGPERSAGVTRVEADKKGLIIEMVTFQQPDLFSVLSHEGLHQFLILHLARPAPLWLNEGLACYFEKGTDYLAAAKNALTAQDRPDLLPWLLMLNAEEFYRNGEIAYPLAWSLVSYLVRKEGKRKIAGQFRKFMGDIRAGKSPMTSFKKRFGNNLAKIQRDWIAWVQSS